MIDELLFAAKEFKGKYPHGKILICDCVLMCYKCTDDCKCRTKPAEAVIYRFNGGVHVAWNQEVECDEYIVVRYDIGGEG